MSSITTCKIKSVSSLLKMPLEVPNYQRPYKWSEKNVTELLTDIDTAINLSKNKSGKGFRYRIGTIILHTENNKYNIVDGQQRIISLVLFCYALDLTENLSESISELEFSNKITQENINNNYKAIKDWLKYKERSFRSAIKTAFNNTLECVVITVNNLSEAFQLFDSQNSRGKALYPHDLLKAYHLREMQLDKIDMYQSVEKWEAFLPKDIEILFKDYLYPIFKWSNGEKVSRFTTKNIDVYKGISKDLKYTYAKRGRSAMPYFQIAEDFSAGKSYFDMVAHYLNMLNEIKKKTASFFDFEEHIDTRSVGYNYAKNLFYAVVLSYYDRFKSFDKKSLIKLFNWAMTIRVDMESLGYITINNYAIGNNKNDSYTNTIPFFKAIKRARTHSDIADTRVVISEEKERWQELLRAINKINTKDNLNQDE